MADTSFENIISDLRNKKFSPVYFLCGDEPYYIDQISDYIQNNVLGDAEKSFNQTVMYGKDTNAATVVEASRRFPMMSDKQVIIVKEAQELSDSDYLVTYMEKPLTSTILVLNYKYKSLDKRTRLYKTATKNAIYFESKKLYDDKLPAWIMSHVSSRKYSIDLKAASLLAEFLGSDLSKIVHEIDKLIITLDQENRQITAAHIEKNIGISKDYNNFELQKAIGEKDILKSNRIINYFADNQKNYPVVVTIATLYGFFSKLMTYHWLKDKSKESVAKALKIHPFFTREYMDAARRYPPNNVIRIISLLREYDLKSKGYGGVTIPPGDLLKELLFKILH